MVLPQPLVDARWLVAHHDEVRLVDCRWYLDGRSGRAAYEADHLPGAVWVDLDLDLSAPPTSADGRHPFPTADLFAASLSRLGIGQETPVVVYDDACGSMAARLWWMLRILDHPVAVLDGGMITWEGTLEPGWQEVEQVPCAPRAWPPTRLIDADGVDALRGESGSLLLDARTRSRYAAGDPTIDPRQGHIPGAKSAPWTDNVSPDGTLLDPASLRTRFGELGANEASTIVCYCGSGVTACHDLLALEIAGLGEATRLYAGSWSQWGADPTRPAATGSA